MKPFISQKTQEICFAVLRISSHIRRSELRRSLERVSYHLIENVAYENIELSLASIVALKSFIQLGKSIYEIELVNAKILERELNQLSDEIKSFAGISTLPDIESFFTKKVDVKSSVAARTKKEVVLSEVVIPEAEIKNEAIEYGNEESGNQEDGSSGIRQEKIASLIGSSKDGRVALKDIVAAFPEVSERTIRYDLKKLFEAGKVIRQGSGGPSNYYTLV
jgi:DNA-binding transcriptional ArsR family regulator